jgi:hypothetical protein
MAMDLSSMTGRTDLFLDYWAKADTTYTVYLYLSGDGSTWNQVWSGSLPTSYTHYSLDLDALCAGNGIALDTDVYVRFRWHARSGYDAFIDDMRIVTGDLAGPRP